MDKTFFEKSTINVIALSLLSFVEALQILVIVALIFSFIPMPIPAFVKTLFPLSLYDVHLERETLFYHVWIAAALGLQAVLMFLNRSRLDEGGFARRVFPYVYVMACFLFIQVFAVFKIFLWGDPWWARGLLYFSIGLGILARIFWPELRLFMAWLCGQSTARRLFPASCLWLEAAAIWLVAVLIFAPDLNAVLSRMFSYDKFYHFDSFIMSPAWAHHNGLILNKDVTSEYSLVVPVIFDGLMKLAGGFDYSRAVGLMIGLCAAYYLLLYGLLRYWTGSFGLSFFAILLSIKLQFFHWGVVPLIWIYPSATPLRFLPDVAFLFFLLRFTQACDQRWLFAAAAANGFCLAWTTDVGLYMYITLLLAAAALVFQQGPKSIAAAGAAIVLPWIAAFGVWGCFYGALVWDVHFWQRTFEFASLFLQGWGALPVTEGLKDKQFFAFCMGFVIPVIYEGTLLYSFSVFLFQRSRPYLFIALVCVYGLGLYHYYIHRSGVTSYYAVCVPLVFVLLFWIQALISLIGGAWRNGLKFLLCVWGLTALITGYLFTYYPNRLNLSGFDWSAEKKFYADNFDFSKDSSLMDALTQPTQPVALISSFETRILMQANRKPFFYYFPMMESEHMRGDKLRGLYLHTYSRLEETLRKIQDEKPSPVFIQTRLYQGPESQGYEDANEGFKQLMAYIRLHYQYQAEGQYLTALTLK